MINTAIKPSIGHEWGGFGAYIHWPFCRRICAYCDFNVYKAPDNTQDTLVNAILADIHRHRTFLPNHPPLDSLYFGGGTPSLMLPTQIERIISTAQKSFGLQPNCEITLEANPTDISSEICEAWNQAGVNRISLGVQSLNTKSLVWLTRSHDVDKAIEASACIADVFENYSLDAIYALPHHTIESWSQEIDAFLSLKAPHYSLYELTIKPGTAFDAQVKRGAWLPANEDMQADLYELTEATMARAEYFGYEISNYAKLPEFTSKHNTIYWKSGDWLGIGPGAHGRITQDGVRSATHAPSKSAEYIADINRPLSALELDDDQTRLELISMGLRVSDGIDISRLGLDSGRFSEIIQSVNALKETETPILRENSGKLSVNPNFRLLTDLLASKLTMEIVS